MIKAVVNGTVVTDTSIEHRTVLIDGERIADDNFSGTLPPGTEIIDAEGSYILPGFIDLHTHLDDRIGEFELADSLLSGTRVAAANGITTLFSFITQRSDESIDESVRRTMDRARKRCYVDVGWHLTPTSFDEPSWRKILNITQRGFRTFKFYTTYRSSGLFQSYAQLEEIFDRLKSYAERILIHCEDDTIISELMGQEFDSSSIAAHATLRPPTAELTAIEKILMAAGSKNVPIHIVHVSTPEGVRLINDSAADVTCETCPQYFSFTSEKLHSSDARFYLCSPPLRDETRRNALEQLVRAGKVDCIATDHCAFRIEDKRKYAELKNIPNGIPGIGALPYRAYSALNDGTDRSLQMLVRHCSANPAKVLGIFPQKGAIKINSDADLLFVKIQDPPHTLRSTYADCYDPYGSFESPLYITDVYLRGSLIAKGGEILPGEPPRGTILCQN